MLQRRITKKNNNKKNPQGIYMTHRKAFVFTEDQSIDGVEACQEIFLTLPQCSCLSTPNGLLEFTEGQESHI